MNYTLSKHAEDVIRERGIDPGWISITLEKPALVLPGRDDPDTEHALRAIPEYGSRVLRVIYNRTREPVHVVTVFFDRTMKGKL